MAKVRKLQEKRKSALQQGNKLYQVADDVWSDKKSKQEIQQLHVIETLKQHKEKTDERITQLHK